MSAYTQGLVILTGINVILALGYWLTANTNQFSLGHAGFMAIGAYTASLLTTQHGTPLPVAMVAGGVLAGIAGGIVGVPGLRLSMLHLAMVTVAFAQLVQIGFSVWGYAGGTGGLVGMTGTSMSLVLLTLAVVAVAIWLFSRSRPGLESMAVRDDELAAKAAGIDVIRVKIATFVVSAFVTGVGGALLAHYLRYISPESFGVQQSIVIVLYVLFGGLYSFWGPIVGAVILTLLPEYVSWVDGHYLFLYGGLMVLLMIIRPQGIVQPRRLRRSTPSVLFRLARSTIARSRQPRVMRGASDA
ncbi:branched-chain amino acid ABC transporter permease [Nocardioides sp.]|uniref:branched-chain amino acid ABC transporter permease n=1 Tax=Nocardioides sp. TaxID=35761 RepID=UPI0039E3D878